VPKSLAQTVAVVTLFAVLYSALPCFMSEAEPGGESTVSLHMVEGESDGSPSPEPCSDGCTCLCGSPNAYVSDRVIGQKRPLSASRQPAHELAESMHPGDHTERIFRPPLHA